MKLIKVIGLHQHIVKLKEGKALLHTVFIALSGKHPVYGKMNAYLSQKLHIIYIQQPVCIIGQYGVITRKINIP